MQSKLLGAIATTLAIASPAFAADLVIGVPNWPSVTVTANVIKAVVEANMGLTVELQTGTNPVIFEAMDKGSMQVHPEVWLPNQQGLVDQYKA
jgi:glycine betaine/proline transport system substrate-binding protein